MLLLGGSAYAGTPLEATRSSLEKWLETRQLISKTRSDWQSDKEAPGPNGWEWTLNPELGPAVKEVLKIYRNERTPQFVTLPVAIH